MLLISARSRSNGSRLQTGLLPRRRSKRLKKRVHFKKEEQRSKVIFKCSAARSLFVVKSISDLPNELSVKILSYFDAKELMGLRCVSIYIQTSCEWSQFNSKV